MPSHLLLLAPLIVILPCWWIFFDKATTISRNVGYARIIEEMIAEYPEGRYRFLGFEQSLAAYRSAKDSGKIAVIRTPKGSAPGGPRITGVRHWIVNWLPFFPWGARYRYWIVNWLTFFALSALCCFLSLSNCTTLPQYIEGVSVTLLALLPSVFTFRILRSLLSGGSSYSEMTRCWREVLRWPPPN